MTTKTRFIALTLLLLTVLAMQSALQGGDDCLRYEVARVATPPSNVEGLPWEYNTLFTGSGRCGGCHAFDPSGQTNVDTNGVDVNLTDRWRTSMMANSSKDPFWRAKVSHETQVNPSHRAILEDKCTSCHAPLGHFNAKHEGRMFTMDSLVVDSLALDGVSCLACHQQDTNFVGKVFSGELAYDSNRVVYGPYETPYGAPMNFLVGFPPEFFAPVSQSENCAGCHTLITETVDLNGNPTGGEFVEQATYHEWLNSAYSLPNERQDCQSCHMRKIEQPVKLAMDYFWLPGREPFLVHTFQGANSFMLKILKEYSDTLGIFPKPALFDSTIAMTEKMLREQTLDLSLAAGERDLDSARFTAT
ncbi:MAG: cytochrome c3 family protein, partial [Bacteroidota bacterium]